MPSETATQARLDDPAEAQPLSRWLGQFTFTLLGFRAANERRFTEHRRWMLRSVALTLSVISNRAWLIVWVALLTPRLHTTFGGNESSMWQTIGCLTGWLGWLIPLGGIECWLRVRGPAAQS